ncbi:alkene reductase [Acuticoccus sp. I52.16.1]|uniref:alkene reductase n=1 Tax=Acuticoccus sp. I52.16.1 TaxID=2928472 RepID=UPI001FD2A791|nr:alkene reductase [Acuticoccus sp. I52.16.1]UOM34625.1 alkene reductase [Acuticoccus sp. I52.16.1]
MPSYPHLFSAFELGDVTLANRIVMAPMTRSRATGNIPNDLMAEYYGARAAGAGLLITEGTAPSANGLGYPRIPGLFSPAQVAGWRKVTDAVHQGGAKIFAQVMHTGRIGHPHNLPEGGAILAPSALAAPGEMYTDQEGPLPHPTPRAMRESEIHSAIDEFVAAARNAVEAGFDGVELHGANGYLIDQFINPIANQRKDGWGGTPDARNRFAIEVSRRVAEAIGPQRVGIRLSPYGAFNGLTAFDGIDAQFTELAGALGKLGLAYLHIVDHSAMGAPEVPQAIKDAMRDAFAGTVILSGGYDAEKAEADLAAGKGELVAFGRPFIANPDLPRRFLDGADLNEPKPDTFYTPGVAGYTDYPRAA